MADLFPIIWQSFDDSGSWLVCEGWHKQNAALTESG